MKRRTFWTGLAVLATAALLGSVVLIADHLSPQKAEQGQGRAAIGGPFSLTDHTGQAVTQDILKGKLSLVYFGYSFCPDICPTDLQLIAQALDQLSPEELADTQALFVTIDPERDTVTQMADYVALFHPSIRGLTGTPDQIAGAARSYRAYYKKISAEEAGTVDYLMDHSAFIYLMNRDGDFVRVFGHGVNPDEIVEWIRKVRAG
ncbi:SCO family protein [Niveispirillum sp.]|uniref:SCO family protein n=1 Tax=Niveispirillum sp. TaxID=1917217 RepID=UPI001B40D5AE|nr:SCO family protein [Niveispirillum sp.]MBP7339905.1 SCO family protein [Niveispirillum sp.]